MQIRIPLPEKKTANKIYAGMHWGVRQRLVQTFQWSLIEYKNQKVTDLPVELTFIFRFKGKLLDCSNCFLMAKLLEDALIKNNILPDDSPEYVQSIHIFSEKGETDEVEITII